MQKWPKPPPRLKNEKERKVERRVEFGNYILHT
jgi:hypothetical protein